MTLEPSDDRWMVVHADRTPVYVGMFSKANAQEEADELNDRAESEGEGRPYRVVLDVVSMDLS